MRRRQVREDRRLAVPRPAVSVGDAAGSGWRLTRRRAAKRTLSASRFRPIAQAIDPPRAPGSVRIYRLPAIPKVRPPAWTEIAPAGSSIRSLDSRNSTQKTTRIPAASPVAAASAGARKAHPAPLVTNPHSQPLAISEASGRANRTLVTAAANAPADAARVVLIALVRRLRRDGPRDKTRPRAVQPHPPDPTPVNSRSTPALRCGRELRTNALGCRTCRGGAQNPGDGSAVKPPTD